MAVYFSGVNTGRDYEVGQTYKMGGDSYVAQPDGSFTNQQTGRNFTGSSNPSSDQTVSWYSDGDQYSSGLQMAPADYAPVREAIARAETQAQLAAASGSIIAPSAIQAGTVKPQRSAGVTASPSLIGSLSAGGGKATPLLTYDAPGTRPRQTKDKFPAVPVKNEPLERIGNGTSQEAPGAIADIGWIRTTTGGYVPVTSSDAKDRLEEDMLATGMWHWRNTIGPSLGILPQPVPNFLDPADSYFDALSGEWRDGQPSLPWPLHHKDPRNGWSTGGRF